MKTKTSGAQPPAGYDSFAVPRVIDYEQQDFTKNGETYDLDVVEAHRYVEMRQKTGNVVLSLNGGSR